MRLVVQRVSEASVVSDGVLTGRIGPGLMILCGVGPSDDEEAAKLLAKKTAELRIFSDKEGKMNLSVKDLGGGVLVVSQFTLFADIRKGRRPFFGGAAAPEHANQLYQVFMDAL
ncbi:MAG: D-aminoacyl-tRNA deacylase, partial [Myxococcota bacterium]|nr:D-aminoacyl-tRNA deacylase [Myxococcota bacterium]